MADHILEGTTIKVRAKVSKGVANPADFQFKFFKDGTEVQQQASQSPEGGEENASVASEPGWVEAKFTVPNVDDTAVNYVLTYKVSHGSETKEDEERIERSARFSIQADAGREAARRDSASHQGRRYL